MAYPYAGVPQQGYPPQAAAGRALYNTAMAAPAPQLMQLQVPQGVGPGMQFQANVNGQIMAITCPQNCGPGSVIQIQAPTPMLQQQAPPPAMYAAQQHIGVTQPQVVMMAGGGKHGKGYKNKGYKNKSGYKHKGYKHKGYKGMKFGKFKMGFKGFKGFKMGFK